MNILVINGDCIQTNSSANLCHLAYLRGLLAAGHQVTLLSADGRDYTIDPAMTIPEQVMQYTIYGVSFYEKLSLRKRTIFRSRRFFAKSVTPIVFFPRGCHLVTALDRWTLRTTRHTTQTVGVS